ncbi:MAG: tripartite tricarboxylate transporter TctB family protein [Clostridiaceae bacterium]|nr:tripartite tricarboxylate transporter TctB family protein [Clostridiaceae bacterium]
MISEIIFAGFIIVISVIWMIIGIFQLGFWDPSAAAGSGFIPTVFAAITLVSSILVIISNLKQKKTSNNNNKKDDIETEENAEGQALPEVAENTAAGKEVSKNSWKEKLKPIIPVAYCIFGIFCLELFGLVITTFTITFGWLLFVSRTEWKKSLMISAIFTLVIYIIFELWLEVPFPGDIIRL